MMTARSSNGSTTPIFESGRTPTTPTRLSLELTTPRRQTVPVLRAREPDTPTPSRRGSTPAFYQSMDSMEESSVQHHTQSFTPYGLAQLPYPTPVQVVYNFRPSTPSTQQGDRPPPSPASAQQSFKRSRRESPVKAFRVQAGERTEATNKKLRDRLQNRNKVSYHDRTISQQIFTPDSYFEILLRRSTCCTKKLRR